MTLPQDPLSSPNHPFESGVESRFRLSRRAVLVSLAGMNVVTLGGGVFGAMGADAAGSRELFCDPQFTEGFGAAWPYGERFSAGPQDGTLLAYRDIAPYHVHLIPEGPVKPGDNRSHPWDSR